MAVLFDAVQCRLQRTPAFGAMPAFRSRAACPPCPPSSGTIVWTQGRRLPAAFRPIYSNTDGTHWIGRVRCRPMLPVLPNCCPIGLACRACKSDLTQRRLTTTTPYSEPRRRLAISPQVNRLALRSIFYLRVAPIHESYA
jgi:hypothetical protein